MNSAKDIESSESSEEETEALTCKLRCESTFEVTHICVNPACTINAFHCKEHFCPCCSGLHEGCENIKVEKIKELLEGRAAEEKKILGVMEEIGKRKFTEMWEGTQPEGAEFYCEGLQKKYGDILRKLYSSKKVFKLDGPSAFSLVSTLKSSLSISLEEESELLSQFQEEVTKLSASFVELKRKMMLRYKQLKMKQQNLKEAWQLKAALTAKACAVVKDTMTIDKHNEELMVFLYNALNKPLQLELIFRASQHHFIAAKFHQVCDGVPNTFTVIKTQFGRTIAGYTPLTWNAAPSGTHAIDVTCESFLLSFDHRLKIPLLKPQYAIYCYTGFGPRFGGGADIHISDLCDENRDSYVNFPSSYGCSEMKERSQKITTQFCGAVNGNSFRVKEYEVFRVYY